MAAEITLGFGRIQFDFAFRPVYKKAALAVSLRIME
jgi:hypothetical protein